MLSPKLSSVKKISTLKAPSVVTNVDQVITHTKKKDKHVYKKVIHTTQLDGAVLGDMFIQKDKNFRENLCFCTQGI